MKKLSTIRCIGIILLIFCLLVVTFLLAGCNQQLVDLTYRYDYAWIDIPGGDHVEGRVESWTDFEDGDQIQVKIDGVTYLTDTTRCVLASGYSK